MTWSEWKADTRIEDLKVKLEERASGKREENRSKGEKEGDRIQRVVRLSRVGGTKSISANNETMQGLTCS